MASNMQVQYGSGHNEMNGRARMRRGGGGRQMLRTSNGLSRNGVHNNSNQQGNVRMGNNRGGYKEPRDHNEILRKHKAEVRLQQAKKQALHEANQISLGPYVATNSFFGNLVVPSLPPVRRGK
eukprot:TRINITY_DN1644_c0_g1_i1.p1 TRINITY_DN1644_c0_g1~~TRINITY_DN1644_c0_g1_i1.p1  ORF type:complete len:123 (-),score=12.14 TRINITY_DN1644_c0_g1_i1:243-611(-)